MAHLSIAFVEAGPPIEPLVTRLQISAFWRTLFFSSKFLS